MNDLTQQLLDEFEALPEPLQREAVHYIEYLKQKITQPVNADSRQDEEPTGAKLAELMEKIASRGTAFQQIKDPSAWQRETRIDRPLPGRE